MEEISLAFCASCEVLLKILNSVTLNIIWARLFWILEDVNLCVLKSGHFGFIFDVTPTKHLSCLWENPYDSCC